MSAALDESLRIVCLIPSATDICVISLGLTDSIVGVTHECDRSSLPASVKVVTADNLNSMALSQAEINRRVQEQVSNATACMKRQEDAEEDTAVESVPSLYPILHEEFLAAKPNLIITQDLCAVCAPTTREVHQTLKASDPHQPSILSLTPETLLDVAANIRSVAVACGIAQLGELHAAYFLQQLENISDLVRKHVAMTERRPRMLLLEWIDPPMDGGHWIPQMMDYAVVECALSDAAAPSSNTLASPRKSQTLTWENIQQEIRPDVILVACCGFDVERNMADAMLARHHLEKCSNARVMVTNGDLYFARPGPRLIIGTAVMALAAYAEDFPGLAKTIWELPFMMGLNPNQVLRTVDLLQTPGPTEPMNVLQQPIVDIEDAFTLHSRACQSQELFYKDPKSGYMVFTEYAHKLRGKCCGSGCRHCPYSHVNVKDKASKIQQPALIYAGDDEKDNVLSLRHGNVRLLFFSGGKDSFLALRALARQAKESPFGVCLVTTFDATSRIVAHQDIGIHVMERQAKHLGVSLLGIPMHRACSEGYVERIKKGLGVLEAHIQEKVAAFVFGDLHLEHIVSWRKENLGGLGYDLQSPLLNIDYEILSEDLERSGVPCIVSSSNIDGIAVGDVYDRHMRSKLAAVGVDLFGENGEFHTEAQVWQVERSRALF